jgi:hypothetical protein
MQYLYAYGYEKDLQRLCASMLAVGIALSDENEINNGACG